MRRLGCAFLALLLVLGVGGAVVDEMARRTVQRRVAAQLAPRVGATPTVRAHGWPFLACLVQDRFPAVDVDLSAGQLDVAGRHVAVTDAHLEAQDVSHASSLQQARAARVTARARLGYSSLSRALGVQLTPAGGNRARIRTDVSVAGFTVPVDVVGVPSVRDGHLYLTGLTGTAAGQALDPTQAEQVAQHLSQDTVLPSRGGMHLVGLAATDAGVDVQLQGADVGAATLR